MALDTERQKGAHLLRRFALGASEAELDYYLKDGLTGAIDKLLNYENVDREVMELFTLGIGHYTEKDIQEGARAFTGWSIKRTNRKEGDDNRPQAEFLFRPNQHDDGSKDYLGTSGNLSGDDVINHLC